MAREAEQRNLSPEELALEAWQKLTPGQTKLMQGNRVTRLEKMVLVTPSFENWMERAAYGQTYRKKLLNPIIQSDLRTYAFPRPEHMEDFQKSSRGVRDAGPSEGYGRSAIGSLELVAPDVQERGAEVRRIIRTIAPGSAFEIKSAQAHFKIRKRKTRTTREFLPNELATAYRSWRKEALREALKIAQEHGTEVKANIVIFDRHRLHLTGEPARGKEAPGYKDLQQACQEEGAEIRYDEENSFYIRVKPKPLEKKTLTVRQRVGAAIAGWFRRRK